MVTVNDVDIDAQNKYGISAAMIAASKGKTEALRILAAAGARLDAQDLDGVSALHYAASEVARCPCGVLVSMSAAGSYRCSQCATL